MSETFLITTPDGNQWLPSTSTHIVECVHCGNDVDTPEEVESYPNGNCGDCGKPWLGTEKRHMFIKVTMPKALSGASN